MAGQAFGPTGAIEAAHQIKTGTVYVLAEQQLMECVTRNNGCNGGTFMACFDYLKENAQALERDYPYTSGVGRTGKCKEGVEELGKVKVTSYRRVTPNSVSQLKAAINEGVVTVGLSSATTVFQMYKSGIINSDACGTAWDQGASVVGYGSENGVEYYILRNSWSAMWGDKGYAKIAAVEGKGICGI